MSDGGTIPRMEQPGRVTLPESPVVWDEEEIESFEGVDGDDEQLIEGHTGKGGS